MDLGRDKTTFNGSQLKLILIDEIKRTIIICRSTMNLQQWLYALQDFDNELEGVKKANERAECKHDLAELEDTINKFQMAKVYTKKNMPIPSSIISKLDAFYKKLIGIYHESGLEMQLEQGALGGFGR